MSRSRYDNDGSFLIVVILLVVICLLLAEMHRKDERIKQLTNTQEVYNGNSAKQ